MMEGLMQRLSSEDLGNTGVGKGGFGDKVVTGTHSWKSQIPALCFKKRGVQRCSCFGQKLPLGALFLFP